MFHFFCFYGCGPHGREPKGKRRDRLLRADYPNGVVSSFAYDSLNRVTGAGLGNVSNPSSIASYNYTLGATGNRTAAQESSGRMVNWGYDGIYRLTQETITGGAANGAVSYGLDPVGNRLSQSSTLAGIMSGSFSYDADDRMTSTEQYDNNGNTLVSGARTFKYDFQNRLKSMTNSANGVAATIVYDGDGNRVAKTVGSTTTKYLVDDLNPTGYPQVVEEIGTGGVQRTYTYGLQRISQNQLLGSSQSSAVWTASFYNYDGFGSVRMLTDVTGAVTDTYDYDAWGNILSSTGSTPNVYLYRGEQFDPDLQLYYLRARYFNPLTGRFLTRDPLNGQITDPHTLHKYLYAGGDPINAVDPTGRADLFEQTFVVGGTLPAYPAIAAFTAGAVEAGALIAEGIVQITAELAAAAVETGIAAWEEIVAAVEEYNAIVRAHSAWGALTRAVTCADLTLLAGHIVSGWKGDKWGHAVEVGGTVGCAFFLDIRVIH